MKQLHTFGRVGRDPRGRTVTVTYYTTIKAPLPVAGGDDATQAAWVYIKDIKELAFDHMEMIEMALRALAAA